MYLSLSHDAPVPCCTTCLLVGPDINLLAWPSEFEVSFVMLNREDEAEIMVTPWGELDQNLIPHLKDRLVTSHFKLSGRLGETGWEQILTRLCITHCIFVTILCILFLI